MPLLSIDPTVLLVAVSVIAKPVTSTGRCSRNQVDCRTFFTQCVNPSDVCDGYTDCRSSIDEDFCECRSNGGCSPGYECVNLFPRLGKQCVQKFKCDTGMRVTRSGCVDINECQEGGHTCRSDQVCINTVGSFTCRCTRSGYTFNSRSGLCDDINECLNGTRCNLPATCENTPGSYKCICPEHYLLDESGHSCLKKDYCKEKQCPFPLECRNSAEGRADCICPEVGYQMLNGTCVDRDECKESNLCERTIGGADCLNLNGSYSCPCLNYFEDVTTLHISLNNGQNVTVCRSKNISCESGCGAQQECIQGGCFCIEGYRYTGNSSDLCEDIDECATDRHDCPERLQCENRPGFFGCVCPEGFREVTLQPLNITSRFDTIGCVDIDECTENLDTCQFSCRNTVGSFDCGCKPGYIVDSSKKVCFPLGANSELLVSNGGQFYLAEMNLKADSLEFREMPIQCDVPVSTEFIYDFRANRVYFVSENASSIYQAYMDNGTCVEVISGREQISTVQIDWLYDMIYWTDNNGVMVSDPSGSLVKTILTFNDSIEHFIVNPFNGWMLFTSEGKVWRVGLDGSHMSRVFEEVNVTTLAFDVEERSIVLQANDTRLLFCPEDATTTMACVQLEISSNNTMTLLDMYVDYAVLEDREAAALVIVSRNGKYSLRLESKNSTFDSISGRVLHATKQPGGNHKCHSTCSYMCVNSPSITRYSCLCPDYLGDGCSQHISENLSTPDAFRGDSTSRAMLAASIALAVLGSTCLVYSLCMQWKYKGGSFRSPSSLGEIMETSLMQVTPNSVDVEGRRQLLTNELPSDVVNDVTHLPMSLQTIYEDQLQ